MFMNLIRKKCGFTLIEILFTVVILGIIIIPITRLIIFSAYGKNKTKDFVVAFNLAKDKMERIKMLRFEDIINEGNDIYSQKELNVNPDAETFLKDYKEKYMIKYEPFDENIAQFERLVRVDESADKVHKNSMLKKITVIVRKKGEGKEISKLVTLICNY